ARRDHEHGRRQPQVAADHGRRALPDLAAGDRARPGGDAGLADAPPVPVLRRSRRAPGLGAVGERRGIAPGLDDSPHRRLRPAHRGHLGSYGRFSLVAYFSTLLAALPGVRPDLPRAAWPRLTLW